MEKTICIWFLESHWNHKYKLDRVFADSLFPSCLFPFCLFPICQMFWQFSPFLLVTHSHFVSYRIFTPVQPTQDHNSVINLYYYILYGKHGSQVKQPVQTQIRLKEVGLVLSCWCACFHYYLSASIFFFKESMAINQIKQYRSRSNLSMYVHLVQHWICIWTVLVQILITL